MSAGATRRSVVLGTGVLALAGALPRSTRAEDVRTAHGGIHGLSSFGELKYAPDFPNFD